MSFNKRNANNKFKCKGTGNGDEALFTLYTKSAIPMVRSTNLITMLNVIVQNFYKGRIFRHICRRMAFALLVKD